MTLSKSDHAFWLGLRWLLLIIVVTTLAYLPGLFGGFLFDDFPNIVTNPFIHANDLSVESLKDAAKAYQPGAYGRPLATVGFALDHYLGDGKPSVFKLHSLLVHVLNACLVFALARRILRAVQPARVTQARATVVSAVLLALVWAIHPLQVSSVLYVVQRMEMLSATFMLLALLAYCRGRQAQISGQGHGWSWLGFSAVLTVTGLLAKESAAITPLLALTVEICLFRFRAASASTRRLMKRLYALGAAFGLVAVALAFWHYGSAEAYQHRDYSAGERLLTQSRVLALYLKQILAPVPSSMLFYYDNFPPSTGLFRPWTTAASIALILALTGSAAWLWRRIPLASLGLLWFFAAHALTSGPVALENVYEHRNYLALFGILLTVYALGSRCAQRMTSQPIRRAIPTALLAGLFVITLIRAMTWSSPLLLAMDMVANNPNSPRASNDLATLYFSLADGDPDAREWGQAIQEFKRGAALPGSSPLPEQGLILMHASLGLPANPDWWLSLLNKLRSRAISPQERMAVTGILSQRQRGFELDDHQLFHAYRILVERAELSAHDYCNIGDHALNQMGDMEFGKTMFLYCVRKSGANPDFVTHTAYILRTEGHDDIADAVLALAESQSP